MGSIDPSIVVNDPTDIDTNNLSKNPRNDKISDVSKAEVEETSCFLDAGATSDCKDVVGSVEVSMATLCSIIPEGEFAELLETEDLLFCSNKDAEEQVIANGRGRESTRRSVRRSARLQNTTHTTGSVFTEEEQPTLQRINDSSKPYETVFKDINEKENSSRVLTQNSTTKIISNSEERDLRCLGAENDEVFISSKDNVSAVDPFFQSTLARLSTS